MSLTYKQLLTICTRLAYAFSEDTGRTFEDVYGEAEDPESDQDYVVHTLAAQLKGHVTLSDDIVGWLDGVAEPDRAA